MITIAECYLTLGEYFLEEDMFKAYGYFEEAARNGSGKAAMKLVNYHEKLKNYDKAYEALMWAFDAHDETLAEASYKLGLYHEYGYGMQDIDIERAYIFYSHAADRGHEKAKKKMVHENTKKLKNILMEMFRA